MTVITSPEATDDLDAIWQWNVRQYSAPHADDYLTFLRGEIANLVLTHRRGIVVPGMPTHRYTMVRRKVRGNGHVAVYRVEGTVINVLRVYHTAQNWQRDFAS